MIYQQSCCDKEVYYLIDLSESNIHYWILYKVFSLTPNIILTTYIAIILTSRTINKIINSRKENYNQMFTVNDSSENICNNSDIMYVLDLFENRNSEKRVSNCRNIQIFSKILMKTNPTQTIHDELKNDSRVEVNHLSGTSKAKLFKLKNLFKKYIYDKEDMFRFTSRFVNMHVVALLTLYHLSLLLLFLIVAISDKFDNLESILKNLNIDIPLNFQLIPSLISVLIVPYVASLFICLIQILIGLRETKKHLLELYKGKCVYLPPIKTLSNSEIASSSFHFGGYLTGYLVWGFFIQYVIIVIIGIFFIILRILVKDIFSKLLLIIIPPLCALIFRQFIEFFASEIIFLKRRTRILALNNFRAFNVFLYFNFFFDCFIGIVSAVMRLLIAFVAAIFMMPRIAYSFMGRHLEKIDYGKKFKLLIYFIF